MSYSPKQKIGAIIYEGPKFLWGMRPHGIRGSISAPWKFIRNRNENLIPDQRGLGVRCDWQWTSDLHITRVFPALGLRLMKRALRDWPVALQSEPPERSENVEVSFVIGHRGIERLPQLLSTLRSIAAQRNVSIECIVVEQSLTPEVKHELPGWIRYVHTPVAHTDMPYCRSWAFNVGARMARGKMLVLHDNDMLVPQDYASEILSRRSEGYEVINLKRFIFYLTREHSKQIFSSDKLLLNRTPEVVVQNSEAGGSVAVDKDTYMALGGFDESFVGWGGEDNEFWDRAQTRSVWPYGYLPIIHLWHGAQPGKIAERRKTAELFEVRSAIPVMQRISELTARDSGDPDRLASPYAKEEQGRVGV